MPRCQMPLYFCLSVMDSCSHSVGGGAVQSGFLLIREGYHILVPVFLALQCQLSNIPMTVKHCVAELAQFALENILLLNINCRFT